MRKLILVLGAVITASLVFASMVSADPGHNDDAPEVSYTDSEILELAVGTTVGFCLIDENEREAAMRYMEYPRSNLDVETLGRGLTTKNGESCSITVANSEITRRVAELGVVVYPKVDFATTTEKSRRDEEGNVPVESYDGTYVVMTVQPTPEVNIPDDEIVPVIPEACIVSAGVLSTGVQVSLIRGDIVDVLSDAWGPDRVFDFNDISRAVEVSSTSTGSIGGYLVSTDTVYFGDTTVETKTTVRFEETLMFSPVLVLGDCVR